MDWLIDFITSILWPTDAVEEVFAGIFQWMAFGAWLATGLFALSYGLFYKWRKNPSGRATFYTLLSLFAIFTLAVLARFLGEYPGRLVVTALIYSSVLVTLWRLLFTLWSRYGHRADNEPGARGGGEEDTVPHRGERK